MSTRSNKIVLSFKGNSTFRYAVFGALFGLTFPIIGTIIKALYSQLPLNAASLLHIQKTDPVLWIVDTAPLFLGILASLVGNRQDVLEQANDKLILREKELEDTRTTLEERVQERTRELQEASKQIEKRVARLKVISDVSHEISSNVGLNFTELLTRITQSISEKTGFYHVGLFLLDENREFAVLAAANSSGGRQMLARRHQLKVGGTGIVGYVSQSGRPRIALDTGTDAVFFNNPDLPKTRSEISLPLAFEESVIGVLDVQSIQPSAFNEEDANALGSLANLLAIAIRSLQTMESGNGRFSPTRAGSRAASFKRKANQGGYSYRPEGITAANIQIDNEPLLKKALASGDVTVLHHTSLTSPAAIVVPVKLRDQVIGLLHIEASEINRKWTDDEIAMVQSISDRAAFALENARLLEDATRRAEQEETIARVTTSIGASTDFDRILQTTIQEIGQALGVSRSFIQIGTARSEENRD
ncbi:MAG: GAF domain-containing protein [Anaerolineales bacterium]|jgi:GAF domain-containing protein|nr:GAF domain-containing protein [Anaerolineales bacterium]